MERGSIQGSEMGDPTLAQQPPISLDDAIPPSMVMHFRPGFFKQPCTPPKFRIDKQLAPKPQRKQAAMPIKVMSKGGFDIY